MNSWLYQSNRGKRIGLAAVLQEFLQTFSHHLMPTVMVKQFLHDESFLLPSHSRFLLAVYQKELYSTAKVS